MLWRRARACTGDRLIPETGSGRQNFSGKNRLVPGPPSPDSRKRPRRLLARQRRRLRGDADRIPGAKFRETGTVWGHFTMFNLREHDTAAIDATYSDVLAS